MSLDPEQSVAHPITGVGELLETFRSSERRPAERRIGLEHEKLLFRGDGRPVSYPEAGGVGELFRGLVDRGYAPLSDQAGGDVIALRRGELTVSLEPGGQLELSGSPFVTAREALAEDRVHSAELREVAGALGVSLATLGYRPLGTTGEAPWMPKRRYAAMRETLGRSGALALDMMLMTATVQVSLDWTDEADCARMVERVARLSPVLVALFANSPIVRGEVTGFHSYRSHVWSDVDATRCGYLPSMFDGSFDYRTYVEWALDAPLLFLRRGGGYRTPGITFRQLLKDGHEGEPARMSDWEDHLSTLFPEVRIKKILEVRAADCVPLEAAGALTALCRGLFYDARAGEALDALLPTHDYERHLELHGRAQREGLAASAGEGAATLADLAREVVAIGREGLKRLDPEDAPLLDPIAEWAEAGRSPSHGVLEAWERGGLQAVIEHSRL